MFVNELCRISVKTFCCCVVKSCFGSEGLYKANQELKKTIYIYIFIFILFENDAKKFKLEQGLWVDRKRC